MIEAVQKTKQTQDEIDSLINRFAELSQRIKSVIGEDPSPSSNGSSPKSA